LEKVQGFFTKSHWPPPLGGINYDNIKGTPLPVFVAFFIANMVKMGAKQKDGP
jgi:hypothetical protein